jgi:pimeloyl-ACP methyl ester carboxylesterase
MVATVLVHGGGFDSRCWDELVPLLDGTVVAVDLPGRGTRAAPLADVTLEDFADAVAAEIVDRDLTDVLLVGHSLAGCTLPRVAERVPERLAHLVFVSCTVPPQGASVIDTLDPEIQELARSQPADGAPSRDARDLAGPLGCGERTGDLSGSSVERLVQEGMGGMA